ncbi:MAG: hypothetical protein IPL95_10435 [Saprospiraceae bacterium]|nr:hypothetical protein [Saprospiraceae bacterium]
MIVTCVSQLSVAVGLAAVGTALQSTVTFVGQFENTGAFVSFTVTV